MSTTATELLDALNAAILAKLTGNAVQSYTINGRDLRYYSLDEMRKLRNELNAEVSSGEGSQNYASFEDPL